MSPLCNSDSTLVSSLAKLLREYGERVLSGSSKLTLTTSALTYLNQAFSRISHEDLERSFEVVPGRRLIEPWCEDIEFIYDIIQKTIYFKLVHTSATLQGAVKLDRFRMLRYLEIKKVPLHLILGLQSLRQRLHFITCSRCIINVDTLFASCGGDMSRPFAWPELTAVNLSFNSIEALDESLKLLPVVEVLDISHNRIKSTGNHLAVLMSLKYLNIGFNQLSCCPSFSVSVKARLCTLVLKHNNLETLDGIAELTNLQELDISENCLCHHDVLMPLGRLTMLRMLNLSGNPLSFHKFHRVLTIHKLSIVIANVMFELDGKIVSKSELEFQGRRPFQNSTVLTDHSYGISRNNTSASISSFENSYNDAIQDRSITSIYVSKQKRRIKPRQAEITDLDFSEAEVDVELISGISEQSATEESVSEKQEKHITTKNTYKLFRKQLGADWLGATKQKFADDIPSHSVDEVPGSEPDSSDRHRHTSSDIEVFDASGSTDEHQDKANISNDPIKESSWEFRDIYSSNPMTESIEREECLEQAFPECETQVFIVRSLDSELTEEQMLLVSITDTGLIEKNVNGNVLLVLDLRNLKSVQQEEDMIEDQSTSTAQCMSFLHLVFGYVRKDKRHRRYLLDDESSLNIMTELLQRNLQASLLNVAKEADKISYQCLKCSFKFKNETCSTSKPGVKIKKIEDDILCPTCNSELVIQVEDQFSKAETSKRVRPEISDVVRISQDSLITSSTGFKPTSLAAVIVPETAENFVGEKVDDCVSAVDYCGSSSSSSSIMRSSAITVKRILSVDHGPILDSNNMNANPPSGSSCDFNQTLQPGESDIAILTNPSASSLTSGLSSEDYNTHQQADASTSSDIGNLQISIAGKPVKPFCTASKYSTIVDEGDIIAVRSSPIGSNNSGHNRDEHTVLDTVNAVQDTASTGSSVSFETASQHSRNIYDTPVKHATIANNFNVAESESLHDIKYYYSDFTRCDHRLHLFFNLSVFTENYEEFVGLIRTDCIHYDVGDEFTVLLVVSTHKIYIFKIFGEETHQIERWLRRVDAQPVTELVYLDVGLGEQSFRLEFSSAGSCYTFLVRDSIRCSSFVTFLTDVIRSSTISTDSKLRAISINHLQIRENIVNQVLLSEDQVADVDTDIKLFILAYQYVNGDFSNRLPVSVIITSTEICLATQDHHLPRPRLLQGTANKTPRLQFSNPVKQLLSNIIRLKCTMESVTVFFFNEEFGKEQVWYLAMETAHSCDALVTAVKIPWQELFGVELEIVNV